MQYILVTLGVNAYLRLLRNPLDPVICSSRYFSRH